MIIFIMLSACLFLTWAYYNDISQYKAILDNPIEFCTVYNNNKLLSQSEGGIIHYDPLTTNPTITQNG